MGSTHHRRQGLRHGAQTAQIHGQVLPCIPVPQVPPARTQTPLISPSPPQPNRVCLALSRLAKHPLQRQRLGIQNHQLGTASTGPVGTALDHVCASTNHPPNIASIAGVFGTPVHRDIGQRQAHGHGHLPANPCGLVLWVQTRRHLDASSNRDTSLERQRHWAASPVGVWPWSPGCNGLTLSSLDWRLAHPAASPSAFGLSAQANPTHHRPIIVHAQPVTRLSPTAPSTHHPLPSLHGSAPRRCHLSATTPIGIRAPELVRSMSLQRPSSG